MGRAGASIGRVLIAPAASLARRMLCSVCMTCAKRRRWSCGAAWVTIAALASSAACADLGSLVDSGALGSDGGMGGSPSGTNDSSELGPTETGIILVHAAGAPSFRLCFEEDLDRLPTPDSELMPAANVVGVEVGSAVRIPPLTAPPGEVYMFSEPLLRPLYPPGQRGPTCKVLLDPLAGFPPPTSIGRIDTSLAQGVHLLVVSGCTKKSVLKTYTKEECGPSYTDEDGNLALTVLELKGTARPSNDELPAQVVHLSQPLESFRGQRSLKVTFGDLTDAGAPHTSSADDPTLGGPPTAFVSAPTFDPSDVSVYAKLGFRVSVDGETLAEQTMADVQRLSAPREVPTTYYAVASNYVLLLLGDLAPKLDDGGVNPDERRNLHLLAVPVVQPNADAGAPDASVNDDDGGVNDDGGL